MFFGIGKKKEAKHAQLNSQSQSATAQSLNQGAAPSFTGADRTNPNVNPNNSHPLSLRQQGDFPNTPVANQASQGQDLFGSQVVPPLHSRDSAMTITNPSRIPSDEEVRQKSQLFDQFRQGQPGIDQQDLKRSVIDEEKKIGKIAEEVSSNTYSDANSTSSESSPESYGNEESEGSSYDYDSLDSYSTDSDETESTSSEENVSKDKFVSIMAYKQATKELNVIRKILSESNSIVDDVKSQIQDESKRFAEIKAKLEEVERKIINLDQTLFNED